MPKEPSRTDEERMILPDPEDYRLGTSDNPTNDDPRGGMVQMNRARVSAPGGPYGFKKQGMIIEQRVAIPRGSTAPQELQEPFQVTPEIQAEMNELLGKMKKGEGDMAVLVEALQDTMLKAGYSMEHVVDLVEDALGILPPEQEENETEVDTEDDAEAVERIRRNIGVLHKGNIDERQSLKVKQRNVVPYDASAIERKRKKRLLTLKRGAGRTRKDQAA